MTCDPRAPWQPPGWQPLDPELAHDRLDRVVTDDDLAAVAQLRSHPHRAVGAAGGLVDVGDLAGQPDPPQRSRRVRTALPGVVARLGDLEHAAGMGTLMPCPVKDSITGKSLLG